MQPGPGPCSVVLYFAFTKYFFFSSCLIFVVPYIYFYSCCCFHFWNTTRATSVAPPPPFCCGRGSSSQQPRHLDKEDLFASGILPPKPAANASCCSSIHAAFKHVHHACSDFECNLFLLLEFLFQTNLCLLCDNFCMPAVMSGVD